MTLPLRAVELREAGHTINQIAETLQTPRATIGDWVKGIQPMEYQEPADTPAGPDHARLSLLKRWCSRCGQSKSWLEFWAAAKYPDGRMQRPQSTCKECVKARRRERRREDPEWAREINRRDWQRIKADPDQLARRRELTRENLVVMRRRRAEEREAA